MGNTDYYGDYKKLDYYHNYNNGENNKNSRVDEMVKPHIFERKDGCVKAYNGHLGVFVWEREE